MKVLVIPEDQQLDRFLLKPVLERLFQELGKPARIEILPEPQLRGDDQALDQKLLAQIVADNRAMVDLFLLVVDRDCDRKNHVARAAARESEHRDLLIACLAVEEVETWMLALYETEEIGASWNDVRRHCDPKEQFAEPLLARLGGNGPGRGRKAAMRRLAGNWQRLTSRCPELTALAERIRAFLAQGRDN